MDQVTQRNAVLVQECAAAAESLKGQARLRVNAVAVFKLAHGAQTQAPAHASAPAAVERRSPERAKNVTRPQFGAKAKAAVPTRNAEAATAKTGTEGEWASF